MPEIVPDGAGPQFVSRGKGAHRKIDWDLYTDGIQRKFTEDDFDNEENTKHWSVNLLAGLKHFCKTYQWHLDYGWDEDNQGNKTAIYVTINPRTAILQGAGDPDPRTFRTLDRDHVRQINTLD